MASKDIESCLRLFVPVRPSAALDGRIARLSAAHGSPDQFRVSHGWLLQIICGLLIVISPLLIPDMKTSSCRLSGPDIGEFVSKNINRGQENLETVARYLNSQEK